MSVEAEAIRDRDRLLLQLLADAEAACGPAAWPRVESLITALVDFYGAGLERMLDEARGAASDRAALDRSLQRDEIVSSLLVLHELVPVPDGRPNEGLIPAAQLVRGARG